MQRYRVNLPLLIGLVVGSIVLVGGSIGLYQFQKSRNASRLLDQEQVARDAGDLKESVSLLQQYLRLRPNDEVAMVRLSETLIDIAEQPLSEPVDLQQAIGRTEQTVRTYPEQTALRRRLVDLYMSPRVRSFKNALDHVSQLLNRTPNDEVLLAMQSDCYFATQSPKRIKHAYRLIGYDETTEEFSEEKATAPSKVRVYYSLARVLRSDSEEELADRVIERMVEVNPESGTAYLLRGSYAEQVGGFDKARPFIEKAIELDPDDAGITVANARIASQDEHHDRARELLEGGIAKHPTNPLMYLTLSSVELADDDAAAAATACERGLEAVPIDQRTQLLVQLTQLQLRSDTPEDARETIDRMRGTIREAYPDYFEARLLVNEEKWFEAAKTFEKYESFFANTSKQLGAELNMMLGLCREKLGETELALEAYNRASRISPDNAAAELAVVRTRNALGGGATTQQGSTYSIYRALALEIAKPEAEQDWEAFDQIAQEYTKRLRLGDAMLEVLRGEVFMRRKMYPEARKQLLKSFKMDKQNLGVRRAAVKLFAADPDQGPVQALKLLDRVVNEFGDLPVLRLERADLLALVYPENLTEQLFALAEGMDDWNTQQKVQLWRGLAKKFRQLSDNESRAECLKQIALLSDNDLPTLVSLFSIARSEGDQEAMRDAQDKILKVVGSKENPTWLYTEAQRELSQWRAAGGQGPGRDRATELVDRALAKRGEWHALHNLKAELLLANRDLRGALASYDRAASLGKQDARAAYQYIKLLMSQARYADAITQLEKIGRAGRIRVLGRDYAECLLRTGRDAEAVAAAQEYVEQAPKNPQVQLWAGRLLSRAGARATEPTRRQDLFDLAGAAFDRAVEINPQSAESWMALVSFHAAMKQLALAGDTIRQAQLVLEEDQNILMFARCYEVVGRRVDAEALYRQAIETADPEAATRVARLAAQFYLGPSYARPDAAQKATPLVNQILRQVAEGELDAADTNASWARSAAARLLASGGAYRQLLDAERLLSSNANQGVLPVDDRLLMVEILAPRPEPVSRLKATRLLEQIRDNQELSRKSELDLARLYFSLGEWRKCRQQIESVIASYPDDPSPRLTYLEMLLQRGESADIDRAVRQVKRLYDKAPGAVSTREMLARVAYKKGEERKATKTLLSLLPKKTSDIDREQLPLLRRVAQRLTEFEQYDRAQQVYELAAGMGEQRDQASLALFIGQHVDADKGLEAIEALSGSISTYQKIQYGNQVLRAAANEKGSAPQTAIDRVEGWMRQALREDPEQISLRVLQADLHDLRLEYERAAEVYRDILSEEELQGVSRAVVLNNLAYLLALTEPDSEAIERAKTYIREAVELLGPGSDILDTRAVIAIADKRYDDAIADLKLAVLDKPSASKFYHLALAHWRAEQLDEATSAWQEAVKRGLERESISRLEREQYDSIKQQIESESLTGLGA